MTEIDGIKREKNSDHKTASVLDCSNLYSLLPPKTKDQILAQVNGPSAEATHPNMVAKISQRNSGSEILPPISSNFNNNYSINILANNSKDNSKDNSNHNNSSSKNSLSNQKLFTAYMKQSNLHSSNNINEGISQCMSPHTNSRKRPMRRQGINIKPLQDANDQKKAKKSFMRIFNNYKSLEDNETRCARIKNSIKRVLDSEIEVIVMAVLTIVGLFASDIKNMSVDKDYDWIFLILYVILAICWLAELICSVIVMNDYLFSFFFWLDLFSIFSLLTEIETICEKFVYLFLQETEENKDHSALSPKIATIVRMVRIIRLIRIVKVYKAVLDFLKNYEIKKKLEEIRVRETERIKLKEKKVLSHLVKKKNTKIPNQNQLLLTGLGMNISSSNNNPNNNSNPMFNNSVFQNTNAVISNNNNFNNNNNTIINISGIGPYINQGQSNAVAEFALKKMILNHQKEEKKTLQMENKTKITKVLFQSITEKILIIILILFFIPPLLDEDVYSKDEEGNYAFLSNLIENDSGSSANNLSDYINNFINNHKNNYYYPIIYVYYNKSIVYTNTTINSNLDKYRFGELGDTFSIGRVVKITYSMKEASHYALGINMLRTLFTFGIMFILSYLINSDTSSLILNPLELMLDVVDTVSKDPVNYKSLEDLNKNMRKSIEHLVKKSKRKIEMEEISVDYEIKTLQFAIIRISALIAIGFGEAGGEILKENINSEQGLNPMLLGKKINSVFGFCFIRNFTEINETLQEKTILFVNAIADIVHSNVNKFGGACNKNIGDSFLLVWKFKNIVDNSNPDQNKEESNPQTPTTKKTNNDIILKHKDEPQTQLVADSALLSFLAIIKKIYKSQTVLAFRNDASLKKKFGEKFKVQMGFGLHLGWGIEGAIGSFYKIDCSYLSPNVNTAARLETATNIYGVDILLSGDLHDCFSDYTKSLCRQIDTVALKGCIFPVKLYTVDINTNLRPGKPKKGNISGKERRKINNSKKNKLKSLYDKSWEDGKNKSITEIYYKKSRGFRALIRNMKSDEFRRYFKLGFNEYIQGNWELAYKYFKQALYIDQYDPPTIKLCNFIYSNHKKAPSDWKGFRKLDSKF